MRLFTLAWIARGHAVAWVVVRDVLDIAVYFSAYLRPGAFDHALIGIVLHQAVSNTRSLARRHPSAPDSSS